MERRMPTFERFLSAPLSLISVLWGKMIAGVIFGLGITTLAISLSVILLGITITNPLALVLGILLSTMAYSAMGILFASIPTGSPDEVIIPLNFFRIPLMFVSGMFIPVEQMPMTGIYAAFLSPLTHTLDLLRLSTGSQSFFGMGINIVVLSVWTLSFLYIGQMFHRIIMKRE
jgi:ABC-2 type transport system permease protein